MTFDPTTRRLVRVMDELAAGDDGYIEDVLHTTATMKQHRTWTLPLRRGRAHDRGWAVVIALAAIVTFAVAFAVYIANRPQPTLPIRAVSNGWIAFSSMPGFKQVGATDGSSGSDLFIVRDGGARILVAGRQGGSARNVCPTFSPDGSRLAYGSSEATGRSIRIVTISDLGMVDETARIAVPEGSVNAPCPTWSKDGQRLAYLQAGETVIRSLDGSLAEWSDADPPSWPLHDPSPITSPKGDRIADLADCTLSVTAADGTKEAIALTFCPYALPAWSPDGKKVLVMEDVSGRDFAMYAVSVDAPHDIVTLAPIIPTNGARSWPGRGDVSWQPIFD